MRWSVTDESNSGINLEEPELKFSKEPLTLSSFWDGSSTEAIKAKMIAVMRRTIVIEITCA